MSGLSGIKAISFDVDGTLWDFESAMRTALEEVLSELAQVDPHTARKLDAERMIVLRDETHERLRGRINDLDAIREESIKQALREAEISNDELGSYLAQVYFRRSDAARALFSDVRPTLERLATRYRLGLLSNGNSRADALGIGDLVCLSRFSRRTTTA